MIRPLLPSDVPTLRRIYLDDQVYKTWNLCPLDSSDERFFHALVEDVASLFVIARQEGNTAVGVARIAGYDQRNQVAHLAVFVASGARRNLSSLADVARGIGIAFDTTPVRKLYCEVTPSSLRQFHRATRLGLLTMEGTLRGHRWTPETYEDVHIFSIERDAWRTGICRYRWLG